VSTIHDACGGFALRPMSWLSPSPEQITRIFLSLDWDAELAWLREMVAEADALDTWENEGGAL
jgi:hypothetical protein